jgi:hypothetical protein
MKTEKKNWETPLILALDGSRVESGDMPTGEGSHVPGSHTGSLAMGRPS